MTIGSLANGIAPQSRQLRLWGNLTAEKVRRHRERPPCRNSISKRDFNCQPTILIISRDRPAHTLHKRPGDRQSQSC